MSHIEEIPLIRNIIPGYKHHWVYFDHGIPVMIIARYDQYNVKNFRQFVQKNGEWVEGMVPPPYPLFGLHTLKNISPFNALIITEGEKCSSVLHQLALPAISTALGAESPSCSDWLPVRYFNRFIILRDNDKSGISYSQKISAEIRRVSPDAESYVVNLTPSISGGDLVDWLQGTTLRGQSWDGFANVPSEMIEPIKRALIAEIEQAKIKVEDCPHVAFKPIEALFSDVPRPVQIKLTPVPAFPLQALPEKIMRYLALISASFSQVPDYAATTFIAAIGGLIGRAVHLRMRPKDAWEETANCWCALVGPPSSKKSPIMRRIFKLFKPLEARAAEEYSVAIKTYKIRKASADAKKEYFDEHPPLRRRYITDDVTTPKLRELMSGNPKGIILRNDELKGHLQRLDKQENAGDRSFMMSCWTGLENYSEDRMCRDSVLDIPLALTWVGCIPPSSLQHYLREAIGQGGGADGFMQRFQFVSFPDNKMSFTLPEEEVPSSLEVEIANIFSLLDEESKDLSRVLKFDSEAQFYFDQWLITNENEVRFGKHPPYWESHRGKQSKALAVLVIILHKLDEVVSGNKEDCVSLVTIKAAVEIQAYYLAHAQRCYESVVGGTVVDAETILCLLKQKRIQAKFKAQDIYHQGLGGLSDSGRVRKALELLRDYGWVISEKVGSGTGRQNEYWILHPRAFE